MVPVQMTFSDLKPRFQGHDIIQRQITQIMVSDIAKLQWQTNRKSYMVYRTTASSVILNNP